ncbi:hypothetical protein [Amycolatopsis sp. PS_44_ISF1]|uniref:hypothetical protein n=1 Tax=Amycolatopsis sp. PS_44_ISF1 TaxID=2974917 RepID=UPI0028DFE9CB|nr:hypothetical protein [Amycolatopsis sp. PS_44_ISF1]MDT8912914.1 hypothetical protein [Amycolatopsis sp. PS_44_ISF1]
MPNSEDFDGGEAAGRTSLFVYLTTRLSAEHRAIMDLFTGPLLADLSAAEGAQQLARADAGRVLARVSRVVADDRFLVVRGVLRLTRTGRLAKRLFGVTL